LTKDGFFEFPSLFRFVPVKTFELDFLIDCSGLSSDGSFLIFIFFGSSATTV